MYQATLHAAKKGKQNTHFLLGRRKKGKGNPLQYSCLENPTGRGAWRATVHGVSRVRHNLATKPPPPPKHTHTHTHTPIFSKRNTGRISTKDEWNWVHMGWRYMTRNLCAEFLFIFFNFFNVYLFIFACTGSSLLCIGFPKSWQAGTTLSWCTGFSLQWLLLLLSMGSRHLDCSNVST